MNTSKKTVTTNNQEKQVKDYTRASLKFRDPRIKKAYEILAKEYKGSFSQIVELALEEAYPVMKKKIEDRNSLFQGPVMA